MKPIIIKEKWIKELNFKELGLYIWLKSNVISCKDGNKLSFRQTSKDTGMCYRSIRRGLEKLIEKKYISKEKIGDRYFITFLK